MICEAGVCCDWNIVSTQSQVVIGSNISLMVQLKHKCFFKEPKLVIACRTKLVPTKSLSLSAKRYQTVSNVGTICQNRDRIWNDTIPSASKAVIRLWSCMNSADWKWNGWKIDKSSTIKSELCMLLISWSNSPLQTSLSFRLLFSTMLSTSGTSCSFPPQSYFYFLIRIILPGPVI